MTKKKTQDVVKYDLGCGQRKQEGFIGVDLYGKPDVRADLFSFPWKFTPSNSVDELYASHLIEHIPTTEWKKKDLFFAFFDECYRILKPGGKMTITAPYYSSMRCWQDPTHRRAISDATFFYLSAKWRKENGLDHYNVTCDFDFTGGYAYEQEIAMRNPEYQQHAAKHFINAIMDIHVILTKK